MKYLTLNLQGRAHRYDRRPCEDAISISADATVFCLADGVSHSSRSREGAQFRTEKIQKWLANPRVKAAFATLPASDIRKHVCRQLNALDSALCSRIPGSSPEDFASTLLCAVELDASTICLIHCGDGMIFGFPNTAQKTPVILSMPDNAAGGAVYYAGHPEQRSRMRVLRIRKDEYSCILLGTDGFTNPYFRYPFNSYLDLLEKLIAAESAEEFRKLSEEQHKQISDDISCIWIDTGFAAEASVPEEEAPYQAVPPRREYRTHGRSSSEQSEGSTLPHIGELPVRLGEPESAQVYAPLQEPTAGMEQEGQQPAHQPAAKGVSKPKKVPAEHPVRRHLLKRILAAIIALALLGSATVFVISTLFSLNRLNAENAAMSQQISILEARVERITAAGRNSVFPAETQ